MLNKTWSRRKFLKVSVALLASSAARLPLPDVQADEGANHTKTSDGPAFQADYRWTNKHLNISQTVERYYDVWNRTAPDTFSNPSWQAGLSKMQSIIRAAQALDKRVRAVGGGWSLSDAAVTEGFLINTKPLNYHRIGLKHNEVAPSYAGDRSHLVFAQCGTTILELNRSLEHNNLSLSTSGASNGQTIVGAFSTGTHGSAICVGSVQDYILGMHVIAENGKGYWLERASEPVISNDFCNQLGAELRHDDDLFNAALVSFGSFGAIHAVVLRAEPIYLLERWCVRRDWDDVMPSAGTLDVKGLNLPNHNERPFHFELVLNPYAPEKGKKGAAVRAYYKRPFEKPTPCHKQPSPDEVYKTYGPDVLGVLGALTDTIPSFAGCLEDALFSRAVPEEQCILGTHGETFGPTDILGHSLSTEIGIDLPDTPAVLNVMRDAARKIPFPGALAVRYVKKSEALLAFTKFDTTCTIEIPAPDSSQTRRYYEEVCNQLEAHHIAYTMHWGQWNCFNRQRVRQMWGPSVDKWLAARRGFLSEKARYTFSNDLLERCGLAC